MAPRATEGGKMRRLWVTGGAFLALTGPEVFRRMPVSVGAFDVVVGELVASPLCAVEGPADQLKGPFRCQWRSPDRDGEPIRYLMTKLRQEGSVGARGEKSFSKGGRGGGGAQMEPGQRHRLTPSPEMLGPRLAEATERAGPKGAVKGCYGARKRPVAQPCGGLEGVQRRVEMNRVEGSPLVRGGGPRAQASSAPFGTGSQRGGGDPHGGGGGRAEGTNARRS